MECYAALFHLQPVMIKTIQIPVIIIIVSITMYPVIGQFSRPHFTVSPAKMFWNHSAWLEMVASQVLFYTLH